MTASTRSADPADPADVARSADPATTLGIAIVLGSAALFGLLGPLSRFAYEAGMEPPAFVAWRAGVGLLGMLVYIGWRARTAGVALVAPWHLPRRSQATLLIACITGFTLNLFMFAAFDRVTVALVLLGFYTYPAIVAVASVLLGRERLDGARAVALGLAVVGMLLVVASQLDPAAGVRFDAIGLGLALGAALSQTIYVLVSRDGYREVPVEQALAWVLFVTVIGGGLLATAGGSSGALTYPIDVPSVLPLLLFTGIVAAAIPSLGFLTGIRAIGGMRAGILMLFEPVVGVALAAWLLAEALRPIQVVGAAAILAAAVVLQRAARRDADSGAGPGSGTRDRGSNGETGRPGDGSEPVSAADVRTGP